MGGPNVQWVTTEEVISKRGFDPHEYMDPAHPHHIKNKILDGASLKRVWLLDAVEDVTNYRKSLEPTQEEQLRKEICERFDAEARLRNAAFMKRGSGT